MTKNDVFFIGLDLGDKFYYITIVNQDGKMIEGSRSPTTPAFLERKFSMLPPCGVAMELGAYSRWVIHRLKCLGKRLNRKWYTYLGPVVLLEQKITASVQS